MLKELFLYNMKKSIVLILLLIVAQVTMAQENNAFIATVNGKKITVSDFRSIYERNLDAIDNEEGKDVVKNLELFINYKLKVAEAYRLKFDTLPNYRKEIEGYKKQLAIPYLQDSAQISKMIADAYYRTKYEVKAKHILIRLSKNTTPKDTLNAFNRISKIRDRILKGEDFEKVAVETSEDPSAKGDVKRGIPANKGNLGYFTAFRMVYPFENAAYNTKAGEVSEPFRTSFGYHIVKVDTIRPSKGELEVAHILVRGNTPESKKKIDLVYQKLEKNERFKYLARDYSDDFSTKKRGGKLRKFGSGVMVKEFEDVAFSLQKEDEYSKPFQTRYGWHIVQLIKKHPVKSFEELEPQLRNRILSSPIAKLSEKAVIAKLNSKYVVKDKDALKTIMSTGNLSSFPENLKKKALLSINEKEIFVDEFLAYAKGKNQSVIDLFSDFKDQQIIDYYKDNLEKSEPEYAKTLKEYKEGLLLFELMQHKVWDKSAKDTLGLNEYYGTHQKKYEGKPLKAIRGRVMNDYQNYLDSTWVSDLRKNSDIKIDKKQLQKLVTFYKKD